MRQMYWNNVLVAVKQHADWTSEGGGEAYPTSIGPASQALTLTCQDRSCLFTNILIPIQGRNWEGAALALDMSLNKSRKQLNTWTKSMYYLILTNMPAPPSQNQPVVPLSQSFAVYLKMTLKPLLMSSLTTGELPERKKNTYLESPVT